MPVRRAVYGIPFALWVAACAPPADRAAAAPAVDSTAVVAAAADLWQRWIAADTAGNFAALAEMVGDSIRVDVRGMPPMIGREAWRSASETMFKSMKVTSMTVIPDLTIPVSNELVYQTGTYAEGSTTGGKSAVDHGRYALAIRKYPDGQWRFAYVMAFSDSTVPAK
ncbi:MAG TPA: hypothetical protein VI383_05910 [Gemmatimonadales bacterium]|nr:hypothetical protein [Gemmatimonadales bacterium]